MKTTTMILSLLTLASFFTTYAYANGNSQSNRAKTYVSSYFSDSLPNIIELKRSELINDHFQVQNASCADINESLHTKIVKQAIEEGILGSFAMVCNENTRVVDFDLQLLLISFDSQSDHKLNQLMKEASELPFLKSKVNFHSIVQIHSQRVFSALDLNLQEPLIASSELELFKFDNFPQLKEAISADINLLTERSLKEIFEGVKKFLSQEEITYYETKAFQAANAISLSHYIHFVRKDGLEIPYLLSKQEFVKIYKTQTHLADF